jgi:hypothetical protein
MPTLTPAHPSYCSLGLPLVTRARLRGGLNRLESRILIEHYSRSRQLAVLRVKAVLSISFCGFSRNQAKAILSMFGAALCQLHPVSPGALMFFFQDQTMLGGSIRG